MIFPFYKVWKFKIKKARYFGYYISKSVTGNFLFIACWPIYITINLKYEENIKRQLEMLNTLT